MRSKRPRRLTGAEQSIDTLDQRHRVARTAHAFRQQLRDSIAPGGDLSPQLMAITDRACVLHMRLSQIEAEYLAGHGLDAPEYTALSSLFLKTMTTIGLQRRTKPVRRLAEIIAEQAPRA